MSVTFHAHREPTGWRSGCAFDRTIHPTYQAAYDATVAHHDRFDGGPCPDAARWHTPAPDADVDAFYADYDRLVAELGDHPDSCVYMLLVTAHHDDPGPELNLSQANATEVLAHLGLVTDGEPHWAGELDPQDLRGRILVARGLAGADVGVPATVDRGASGAMLVDCGRPVGYVDAKLDELEELADWAERHGVTIEWS